MSFTPRRRGWRSLAGVLSILTALSCAAASTDGDVRPAAGRGLYLLGQWADGKLLEGRRDPLPTLAGKQAACTNCHRRSGLGSAEGEFDVPPITPRYLAEPREESRLSTDTRLAPGYHVGRGGYDDVSLARAIRDGVVPGGGHLNDVMPRYRIDDATMNSLLGYLKSLGGEATPGVAPDTIHFAAIAAPDAEPGARRAMFDVLERYAEDPYPAFGAPRKMLHPNRMVGYRAGSRRWVIHEWALSGPASGWERQLAERLASEPVFAVLSGLAGRDWGPVHRFCERAKLPCILPNVDAPEPDERDFYSVYFSAGVGLEAALAAKWLAPGQRRGAAKRIVQVYRPGDIGAQGASAFRSRIGRDAMRVVDRRLANRAGEAPDFGHALGDLRATDALILWLRSGDLSALPPAPPAVQTIVVSGLMGELSASALPPAWRSVARMTYPAEVPERAAERTALPRAWMEKHGVRVVNERVQIDTYVACAAMSEILGSVFEQPSREQLVERFEDMLGRSTSPARYPRLGLGQGQRFASKGGYLVRFDIAAGGRPVPDTEWLVP